MQHNRNDDLRVEYSSFKKQRQANQNILTPQKAQSMYPNNRIYQNPPRANQRPQPNQYRPLNQPQYTNRSQINRIQPHNRRPQSIHLKSINQPTRVNITRNYAAKNPPKQKRKRSHSKLLDFLFGLLIGFAVFGTAAYFACKIIIDIFL